MDDPSYYYEKGTIKYIVSTYTISGHPLGKGIEYKEVKSLLSSLLSRLGSYMKDNEILDLSPESLDSISPILCRYIDDLQKADQLNDEGTMHLVREIGAYIGEVFMRGYHGEWRAKKVLWGTEFIYNKPVKVIKGNSVINHTGTIIDFIGLSCEILEKAKKHEYRKITPYYWHLQKSVVRETLGPPRKSSSR